MKKIFISMLLIVFGLCLVGCVHSTYGYQFHFYVDGGNGTIKIETSSSFNPDVKLCKNVEDMCTLDCVEESYFIKLNGGKKGSREITFIATPNMGYQVKEWLFNGEIVDGNKTNSYTAIVTSEEDYVGVIAVRFEEIEHTHNYIDGLCECGEFDSVWLNENFRLSDEQILFKGSVDDEFNCDVILLTLKHTTTYIELSKKHFKLDEITEVVYISSTPPSHFYEPGNEDKLNNFHQIVFLYVDVETKEDIIELIKELEKLPFIRSAEPNYIEHLC